MSSRPRLRADLLTRYGTKPIPRYTSYPSANLWPAKDAEGFAHAVYASIQRPVSLYLHVPFCHKLCYYCGCNMLVTRNEQLVERYLDALDKELDLVAAQAPKNLEVVQIHLGGGTPTFLTPAQLERAIGSMKRHFPWKDGIEMSIEVHPPVTTEAQLETLARLGFNRISMGVQDFDPEVQQIINRIQPFEQTKWLVDTARKLGFISVNMDLMYGLPKQSVERFQKTLDQVKEISPDRIALFGYAHMPAIKKAQGVFKLEDIPTSEGRLALMESAIERLLEMGYAYIGLDHFAKDEDELTRARADGTLRRNFMGYTTCKDSDMLAFGPSSIAEIDGTFVQNAHEVREWAKSLEEGRLAVKRGWQPTQDDHLRRKLIMELFCQLEVDTASFAKREAIDFERYFQAELAELEALEKDGLVERQGARVKVTPQGQLLLRNVAAVFDAYLKKPAGPRHHSKAV